MQEVLSTSPAKLSARGGRTAAIDGLARLVYTLRTRYTTSLMRGYFDAEDRMVGREFVPFRPSEALGAELNFPFPVSAVEDLYY